MGDNEVKKTEFSNRISEWFKSKDGIKQIDEARSDSDKLINYLNKESSIDLDSLKKPFNL